MLLRSQTYSKKFKVTFKITSLFNMLFNTDHSFNMEAIAKFLRVSKGSMSCLESYDGIQIVIGNEACDLDSTICTLAYGVLLEQMRKPCQLVLPVLNCNSKYFPLRTEIVYLLNQHNLDPNLLIFKDDVDFKKILKRGNVETILVDHHVLTAEEKILEDTVTDIFDHRPINKIDISKHKNVVIEQVGSCATLIVEQFNKLQPDLLRVHKGLTRLLYSTIVYDTLGLDVSKGRTTNNDLNAADLLENITKTTIARKELFDQLWRVHNDISSLTPKDLLYRDLKITERIPVPGLPMLVRHYLKLPNVLKGITDFGKEHKTDVVVLIGIDAQPDEVQRDIGVYFSEPEFKDILLNALMSDKNLQLEEFPTIYTNIICFKQKNVLLTRKYIIPLINKTARSYRHPSEAENIDRPRTPISTDV